MSSSSKHRLISHPHQSLATHLDHVDEVSGNALNRKVLGKDFFTEVDVELLRKVLVYFHDFGKAMAFFQYRIIRAARYGNKSLEGLIKEYVETFEARPDTPFLDENCEDPRYKSHSIMGAFLGPTALPGDVSDLLAAIVIEVIARHHGHLKNFELPKQRPSEGHANMLAVQWPITDVDGYESILTETGLSFEKDIALAQKRFDEYFFDDLYDKLHYNKDLTPYFQTLFLFSLLLAGDKGDMMLRDRKLAGWVSHLAKPLVDHYKTEMFGPPKAGATGINAKREEAYQRVVKNLYDNPDSGFYSISLPTGLGKTLTAYNAAVHLQSILREQNEKINPDCTSRIIYCLPFTSVIDQNAEILEEILMENKCDAGLLAKHHYLSDWPTIKDSQEAEPGIADSLEYSEREYLVEGWEYTLTVTTFVQFVETIFSNRNRTLRKFHNFANAIVVLDEVQNIPANYFGAVAAAMRILHQHMGTRFVFVTATQPFLMQADEVVELTDPTFAYTRKVFTEMNRIDLNVSLWKDGPDDLESQIELFKRAVAEEDGKSFLFIFNYVKDSRLVFEALRNEALEGVIYLYLSSAILPILRKKIIARVKNRKKYSDRVVVVSTQLVEAGVDIDLDIVYRAFAPLDSINQSAGRCNRNAGDFRGSVRLFKNLKQAKKLYGEILVDLTEKVLNEAFGKVGMVLPESMFYLLNENYAGLVRSRIAEGHQDSENILKNMRQLKFEDVAASVKLIEKTYTTYGAFIDDPLNLPTVNYAGEALTSTQVYERMMAIFKNENLDRWGKKQALRLLRPALLQYVVQFPESAMPIHLREEASNKPFVRLTAHPGNNCYKQCYDLITGYFTPEEKNFECL